MNRSTITDAVLILVAIASVSVNIMQARKISSLRGQDSAETGIRAEPIIAKDLDGRTTRIEGAGELPAVFYVFSPQCGWCERNWPGVQALTGQLRGRYRVVGLSLGSRGTAELVTRKPLALPVLADPSAETVRAYKLASTPQTIAVSRDGRVERVWEGAYDGTVQKEIERYFGVSLPDLAIARK